MHRGQCHTCQKQLDIVTEAESFVWEFSACFDLQETRERESLHDTEQVNESFCFKIISTLGGKE